MGMINEIRAAAAGEREGANRGIHGRQNTSSLQNPSKASQETTIPPQDSVVLDAPLDKPIITRQSLPQQNQKLRTFFEEVQQPTQNPRNSANSRSRSHEKSFDHPQDLTLPILHPNLTIGDITYTIKEKITISTAPNKPSSEHPGNNILFPSQMKYTGQEPSAGVFAARSVEKERSAGVEGGRRTAAGGQLQVNTLAPHYDQYSRYPSPAQMIREKRNEFAVTKSFDCAMGYSKGSTDYRNEAKGSRGEKEHLARAGASEKVSYKPVMTRVVGPSNPATAISPATKYLPTQTSSSSSRPRFLNPQPRRAVPPVHTEYTSTSFDNRHYSTEGNNRKRYSKEGPTQSTEIDHRPRRMIEMMLRRISKLHPDIPLTLLTSQENSRGVDTSKHIKHRFPVNSREPSPQMGRPTSLDPGRVGVQNSVNVNVKKAYKATPPTLTTPTPLRYLHPSQPLSKPSTRK